jgi:hypothetical protein
MQADGTHFRIYGSIGKISRLAKIWKPADIVRGLAETKTELLTGIGEGIEEGRLSDIWQACVQILL